MNDFEALVSLNLIPQIGSARLERLLEHFGQPEAIFRASRQSLTAVVGEQLGQSILDFDTGKLKADLALAQKSGIKVLTLLDQEYPAALRQIPGPPMVLYCLGQITPADNLAVGIVGSRQASFYGLNNAQNFAAQLAARGITVVSGMARGVDTFAHRGALKAKGRTLAVIGSGFKHIYPQENADLAEEIAACGAVISEFPMEVKPLPQNFPRRNRLISGLSLGVLITEAARNSGALITADFALEQGKEVFALPGRIDSAGSLGTNALLKQGAKLVTCCEDILEELNLVDAGGKDIEPPPENKIPADRQERELYGHIGDQPVAIDELVQKSSLASSRVLNLLLKLQFKKLIRILPGKQYMRN